MNLIFRYIGKYKAVSVLSPVFKLLEACFELTVPLIIADLIDKGIATSDNGLISSRIVLLVIFAVVGFACAITAQFFAAKAACGITSNLRGDLFSHVEKLSVRTFERTGSGRIITGLTSDINQISSGINLTLRLLLRSPFIVIGAVIMAFTVSSRLSLIFVAMLVVLSVFIAVNMKLLIPLNAKTRDKMETLVTKSSNGIEGSKVIRGFNRQDDDYDEFSKVNSELNYLQRKTGSMSSLLNPVTFVIVNLCVCLLIYRGAINVSHGNLTQGQVVALYNYMSQILVELIKLANLIVNVSRAVVCANRVENFFKLKPDNKGTLEVKEANKPHAITFSNVSFRYPDSNNDSLSDISFSILPGEKIGIVGKTGCGKSTLAALIAGIVEPTAGEITLDDINMNDISDESRSKAISMCLQKAGLFTGTVRYNISLDREGISESDIADAAKNSMSEEFISRKPEGYDYKVFALGTGLSGGQKQRLSIARTLAGKPGVVIFDDSTSALDAGTERQFLKNLDNLENRPTVIMVSQKINSIKNFDRIILLEDGRISYFASHDELLLKSSSYRQLCSLQGVS